MVKAREVYLFLSLEVKILVEDLKLKNNNVLWSCVWKETDRRKHRLIWYFQRGNFKNLISKLVYIEKLARPIIGVLTSESLIIYFVACLSLNVFQILVVSRVSTKFQKKILSFSGYGYILVAKMMGQIAVY